MFKYKNTSLCLECADKRERMEDVHFRRLRDGKIDALRAFAVESGDRGAWALADAMQREQRPESQRTVVMNTIHVSGSQIGMLNTGTVKQVERLDITLTRLKDAGSSLTPQLAQLAEAVLASPLDGPVKEDAVRHLDVIGSQVGASPPQPTVTRAAIAALQVILSTSADLTQLWQAFLPAILKHFGLASP